MEINRIFGKLTNNSSVPPSDDQELQLSWIRGLIEQVEFANKPDVLPDFVLQLRIRRTFRE